MCVPAWEGAGRRTKERSGAVLPWPRAQDERTGSGVDVEGVDVGPMYRRCQGGWNHKSGRPGHGEAVWLRRLRSSDVAAPIQGAERECGGYIDEQVHR